MRLRARTKYCIYTFLPGFAGQFPYYGTRVHFRPGSPIFRVVCESGIYEPHVVNALIPLVRPGTTVFDVGANIGLMAIPVLHSCATCRVVSFEPSPNSVPYLRRTVNGSAYRDRWMVVEKGVSRQPGMSEFAIGGPKDALFEGFKSQDRLSRPRAIVVEVSSLDAEWHQLGCPEVSVIKIDVEGAEGLVLEGAYELIKSCHPSLVLEWYEPYLQTYRTPVNRLLSVASELGYKVFALPGGVPIDDARSFLLQRTMCSNFVLLH